MEHSATQLEFDITSEMDFVVPLKQVGIITRSVLEAITVFYRPRRIFVISSKNEKHLLMSLLTFWNVGKVEFLDEESFFIRNFNLSLEDILCQYNENRDGDQREPGWWIQQLIKLGAATQIPDISCYYVVWDGDLIPTRRWKLCDRDADNNINYYIAVLQSEPRSVFNTAEYAKCILELIGLAPIDPPTGGGTFVAHHMVFNQSYVRELLQLMAEKTQSKHVPWPLLIMSQSKKYYRFSEYKTYSTFMLNIHPKEFRYHDLALFGDGGLRFREANSILAEILSFCPLEHGGLSYLQVHGFICNYWKRNESLTSGLISTTMPAYVQLDHVYGLSCVDLNFIVSKQHKITSSLGNCRLFKNSVCLDVTNVVDNYPKHYFSHFHASAFAAKMVEIFFFVRYFRDLNMSSGGITGYILTFQRGNEILMKMKTFLIIKQESQITKSIICKLCHISVPYELS